MGKTICWVAIGLVIFLTAAIPQSAQAQDILPPGICEDVVQKSGAIYRVCMPTADWNKKLVIFAHGYVSYLEPIGIPEDQLVIPDGSETYIPYLLNQMGFAFATTSYPENGLTVLSGLDDVRKLAKYFNAHYGKTTDIFLVGASEGGLIAALGVEKYPKVFDGGMALCGPVGDFQKQINYWGDFRVVFDYFYDGVLPPTAVNIPQELIDTWTWVNKPIPDDSYEYAVLENVSIPDGRIEQLLNVTKAPIDSADPYGTMLLTVDRILWYNVFATNDGAAKLGGIPFDNTQTIYWGSANDIALNQGVVRYAADPIALANIQYYYQTSGKLVQPLITLHTTGDPIVPYWHETIYRLKTAAAGSGLKHINIPVDRYGHCAFNTSEVLFAFSLMHWMATGEMLSTATNLLPDRIQLEQFEDMAKQYQLPY